jgi:hypothetical protein
MKIFNKPCTNSVFDEADKIVRGRFPDNIFPVRFNCPDAQVKLIRYLRRRKFVKNKQQHLAFAGSERMR